MGAHPLHTLSPVFKLHTICWKGNKGSERRREEGSGGKKEEEKERIHVSIHHVPSRQGPYCGLGQAAAPPFFLLLLLCRQGRAPPLLTATVVAILTLLLLLLMMLLLLLLLPAAVLTTTALGVPGRRGACAWPRGQTGHLRDKGWAWWGLPCRLAGHRSAARQSHRARRGHGGG